MLALPLPREGPVPQPMPTGLALEQIYERHHGIVFRVAYRITGNAADAEDILQTVFLRLLGRGGGAEPLAQPESYLRRAAIHAAIDLIRERRTRGERDAQAPQETSSPDPELRHTLRQALATLEPRHAEMFVLRFFEGFSNGEIARHMGISTLSVAVTLHRIRGKLQKQIVLAHGLTQGAWEKGSSK